jgi:hypothetical protein
MLRKKVLSVILTVAMVFTMIPATVWAQEEAPTEAKVVFTAEPDQSQIVVWGGDNGAGPIIKGTDETAGKAYWSTNYNNDQGCIFIYCNVSDEIIYGANVALEVAVEYLDRGTGSFAIQFADDKVTEAVVLTDSGEWKTHTFQVDAARMDNAFNSCDFRIGTWAPGVDQRKQDVAFASVTVREVQKSEEVSVLLTENPENKGINAWGGDNGEFPLVKGVDEATGKPYWQTNYSGGPGSVFFYCNVADNFLYGSAVYAEVDVEYWDKGTAWFSIEGKDGRIGDVCQLTDTGEWKTHTFQLKGVDLTNSFVSGSDFRLGTYAPNMDVCTQDVAISKITVRKVAAPALQKVASAVFSGDNAVEDGMTVRTGDGGSKTLKTYDGVTGWQIIDDVDPHYIYGNIADSGTAFVKDAKNVVEFEVVYYDDDPNPNDRGFNIAYDAMSTNWQYLPEVKLTGTHTWKTYTVRVEDARLHGGCNGDDFRIGAEHATVTFASVKVTKIPSVRVNLSTSKEDNIFQLGDTVETALAVANEFDDAKTFKVDYKVTDIDKKEVKSGTFALDVDANSTADRVIGLGNEYAEGLYNVNVTVTEAGGEPIMAGLPFTVAKDPSKVSFVTAVLDKNYNPDTAGVRIWTGDGGGSLTHETYDGVEGMESHPNAAMYFYCDVKDDFIKGGKNKVRISFDYYDYNGGARSGLTLSYNGVYAPWSYTDKVYLSGSNTWKTYSILVDDALFENGCNGADFRIDTDVPICISKIVVEKIPHLVIAGETEKGGNIFFDDENIDATVKISNEYDTAKELTVNWKVLDYNNTNIKNGSYTLSMEAGELDTPEVLSLGNFKKGTYTLVIEASDGDDYAKEEMPFSFIRDISGLNVSDVFCVNTHFQQGKGDRNVLFPLIGQSGATMIRDGYTGTNDDPHMNMAKEYGLGALVCIGGDNLETQAGREAYAQRCAELAVQLKGRVAAFEILNEYNSSGTASNYMEILKLAAPAIKEANPDIMVVAGGAIAYDEAWLKRIVDLGACEYADAISFHPYCYPQNGENAGFMDHYKDFRAYVDAYLEDHNMSDKKIELWCTETGWPTQYVSMGGVPEVSAASYGAQMYVQALAEPGYVDRIFWYDFQNDSNNPAEREHNFGLVSLTAKGAAKMPFVAFNAVAGMLADTEITKIYSFPDYPDIRLYKFHRSTDGKDVLALWSNRADCPVTLNLGSADFVLYDMFGNVENYTAQSGVLSLNVTAQPMYLEGDFSADVTLDTPAFTVKDQKVSAVPGEIVTVTINRSDAAVDMEGSYEFVLPDGWTLEGDGAFTAGKTQDTYTLHVPAVSQSAGDILIFPVVAGSRVGSLKVQTEMVDAFVVKYAPIEKETGDGWNLQIQLINQYKNAQIPAGTVTITKPDDMAHTYDFEAIPAGETKIVTVDMPMLSGDWSTEVSFKVEREDGYSSSFTRKLTALTAVKTPNPITVDGKVDSEWDNAMQFVLDNEEQTRMLEKWQWGGVEDLSAVGRLMWDDEYLYFSIDATDKVHAQQNDAENSWKSDGIQFAIDPGRSLAPGSLGATTIGYALHSDTWQLLQTVSTGITELQGNNLKDSVCVITRDEGNRKTCYEMKLKWSDILPSDMIPGEGTNLGFSFLINDGDTFGEEAARRGWMEYMSGIGYEKDVNMYGDLILTEKESITIPDVEKPDDGHHEPMPPKPDNWIDQSTMTATASSWRTGMEPEKVFDGDPWTCWRASPPANKGEWIEVDLGKVYDDINSFIYTTDYAWDAYNGGVTEYKIEVSTNGKDYTEVVNTDKTPDKALVATKDRQVISFDTVSARYVKFTVLNSFFGYNAGAAEIDIGRDLSEPPPVETKTIPQSEMTAESDHFQPSDPAANAIDGNPNTMWHSEWDGYSVTPETPASLTLNLGGTYMVSKLRYLPRQSGGVNGNIVAYNLYVSMDGVSFTKVVDNGSWPYLEDGDNPVPKDVERIAEFTPVKARYVKLEAIGGEHNFASAAEVNIEYTEKIEEPTYDFLLLDLVLSQAKSHYENLDAFLDAGKQAFVDAYEAAVAQRANPESQETVDAAATALSNAMFALRYIPSKDGLADLIAQGNNVDAAKYTPESVAELKVALTAAAAVMDDGQATKEMVKAAEERLAGALNALQLSGDVEQPGESEAPGASEVPGESEQPAESEETSSSAPSSEEGKPSQTGDTQNMVPVLLVGSVSLVLALFFLRKKADER